MRFHEYATPEIKLFHSTVTPGKRKYRAHHHVECELSLFINGEGIYTVGNKEYSFRKGDVFLFGSNEVHCITNIYSGEHFDLLNIHFEPRLLWNNDNDISQLLKLFNQRSDTFSNRISRSNPETYKIREKIIQIENEFQNKDVGYELSIKLLLYTVLLIILRKYNYVNHMSEPVSNSHNLPQLSSAMDYINLHINEELTLDDIASHANLSKAYFSTLFSKYNGLSLWEYITIRRIEKAVELLKHTSMTKLDIAQQCGFSSSSNFYKAFRKITGKTPKAYQTDVSSEK